MKALIKPLILIILSLWVISCSKDSEINSKTISKEFSGKHNGVFFSLPPSMVSMFLDDRQTGNQEVKMLLNQVDHLSFLVMTTNSKEQSESNAAALIKQFEKANLVEISKVQMNGETIHVLVYPLEDNIKDMSVLLVTPANFYSINFQGNIDIDKITNLARLENIAVLTNLNKIKP